MELTSVVPSPTSKRLGLPSSAAKTAAFFANGVTVGVGVTGVGATGVGATGVGAVVVVAVSPPEPPPQPTIRAVAAREIRVFENVAFMALNAWQLNGVTTLEHRRVNAI